MMDTLYIAGAVVVGLLGLWFVGFKPSRKRQPAGAPIITPGVTVASVPLLTEPDIVLYNLIRMAVQDRYLVLAQVPLWSFISVEAAGEARTQLLNHMALKRVDFVLVHPGSRHIETVVQIEGPSQRPHQLARQRVIEAVLDAAGIKLIKLNPDATLTVPALAALLGMEPEE